METEIPEENERETVPTDIEWEHRILCSDGNCIGVIGPDGRCKECGKEYEGTLAEDHFSAKEEPSPAENADEKEDPSPAENAYEKEDPPLEDMPHEAADNDDWQDRVLCSDGNCIGVIGPDGRCKECGKS
jgi:hypothetical protein